MEWLRTPVFLPGKPHEQRSLVGYSPWRWKDLDTTNTSLFGKPDVQDAEGEGEISGCRDVTWVHATPVPTHLFILAFHLTLTCYKPVIPSLGSSSNQIQPPGFAPGAPATC